MCGEAAGRSLAHPTAGLATLYCNRRAKRIKSIVSEESGVGYN